MLEVVTTGPVLRFMAMPDGNRLARFVEPGIEVNQVFGSLTAVRADGRIVEVPAGLPGPYEVRLGNERNGVGTWTRVSASAPS